MPQKPTCPCCNGTGHGDVIDHGFAEHGQQALEPTACRNCGGSGYAHPPKPATGKKNEMTNELWIPDDAPVMRLNTVAPKVVLRINTDGTVELPEGPVEAVREFWRTMYEYRAVLRLALRQARRQTMDIRDDSPERGPGGPLRWIREDPPVCCGAPMDYYVESPDDECWTCPECDRRQNVEYTEAPNPQADEGP